MNHQIVQISSEVSAVVLTVGSEYRNHRGGIGSVLETYSKHFYAFNYVCTYGISSKKIYIISKFIKSLCELSFVLIRNKSIKIIHIHGAAKGSFFRKFIIFIITKYLFGKQVIFHCHGSEMEKFFYSSPAIVKKMMSRFFNHTDLIICLSSSWASFFNNNFSPKKLVVLENIVEEVENKTQKNVDFNRVINFLFMGAVGNRKGIFDLLDVITTNKQELTGKMRLIIGGNGEIKRLTEYIESNKLSEIVTYAGWVTGDLKKKLFNETDVYILPSYNEGLPISILEAMTNGLPVISTYVGGIPEIIKNDFNGNLFTPGDKKSMYSSLRLFIDNPILCAEFGSNALKQVEPYYAKNVIPKLETIYKSLLN